MKKVLIFFCCMVQSGFLLGQEPDMMLIRDRFFGDESHAVKAEGLYHYLEQFDQLTPLQMAFKGTARAMMADDAGNVLNKWRYFRQGRKLIDQAVLVDPQNPEIRLLRFSVQCHIPALLNYDHRTKDETVIEANWARLLQGNYSSVWLDAWKNLLLENSKTAHNKWPQQTNNPLN